MRRSLFRTHTRTLTRAASTEPLEIRQASTTGSRRRWPPPTGG